MGDDPTRTSGDPWQLGPIVRPPEEPLLVPARMVNEVLYCERLMFLEWVHGEFADNFYTVDGRAHHRRVDEPSAPLPEKAPTSPPNAVPESDEPAEVTSWRSSTVARSVWLTSDRLGLTAKIDLVECEGLRAVPIEFKRGKSPDIPERAHLPERAQLCAQVLLLREHGYDVDRAEIFFADDHRRVTIDLNASLEQQTLAAIERAKQLARSGQLPAPLDGSPKCQGCSLAPLCLPDELTLLQRLHGVEPPEEPEEAPTEVPPERTVRPLFPGRDDKLALYVQAHGAKLSLDGLRLRVTTEENKTEARLLNTSQVSLFGNVSVTTPAIRALLERDIPLCFFTYGGWYLGRTAGQGSNNVELRLAQYRAVSDPGWSLSIARKMIEAKISNQRTLLRRNLDPAPPVTLTELRVLARKATLADAADTLLGLEGTAARLYFRELPALVRDVEAAERFSAEGRNRRPPRDPLNATLSYLYSLLVKDCSLAVSTVGLDPLLGVFHRPRFGRPGLALDLMEEFRPLIGDSVAVTAFNTGVLAASDFLIGNGAAALRPAARKRLIEAYERRMDGPITHPLFGYRLTYRRLLELQARLLARHLLGELESYPAFRTR